MSTREAYENPENMAQYERQAAGFWDFFPKEFTRHFVNLVNRREPKGRILNIGSGAGHDSIILRDSGLEVIALDISSSMTHRTNTLGFTTFQGNMFELPFKKETLPGIWSHKTLVHASVEQFPDALAEINRVLKPSGILSIGMIEGWETATRISQTYEEDRDITFFKISQLSGALRKAGFRPVSSEGHFRIRRIRAQNTSYLVANCIKQG